MYRSICATCQKTPIKKRDTGEGRDLYELPKLTCFGTSANNGALALVPPLEAEGEQGEQGEGEAPMLQAEQGRLW